MTKLMLVVMRMVMMMMMMLMMMMMMLMMMMIMMIMMTVMRNRFPRLCQKPLRVSPGVCSNVARGSQRSLETFRFPGIPVFAGPPPFPKTFGLPWVPWTQDFQAKGSRTFPGFPGPVVFPRSRTLQVPGVLPRRFWEVSGRKA